VGEESKVQAQKATIAAGAQVVATGRYLTLIDDHGWEYVTRPGVTGIVVIVAVTGDGDEHSGETLADAAARELAEETGFAAAEMEPLIEGPIAVGVSDETVSFFRAHGLTRVGPGGGDASENITVHQVPLSRLRSFLASSAAAGLAIDTKIYAGLYLIEAGVRT
jgi:ADP-ribose pyrophosphatase